MSRIMEWIRSVKPDLEQLQADRGIPALFAAAQFCHESAGEGPRGLSELAEHAHNYAGLKWDPWQLEHGCRPVVYGSWEVVDGVREEDDFAFCGCPDWPTWLTVYADLLTGRHYGPALRHGVDPFLYGYHIWRRGWATDPVYLTGLAKWFGALWDDYADTIPKVGRPGAMVINGARVEGRIEGTRLWVPARPVIDHLRGLGYRERWDNPTQTMHVTAPMTNLAAGEEGVSEA